MISTSADPTNRSPAHNSTQTLLDAFLYPLQNSRGSSRNHMAGEDFLQEMTSPPSHSFPWIKSLDLMGSGKSPSVPYYRPWNFTWDERNWSIANLSTEASLVDYELSVADLSSPRAILTALILGLICAMTICGNILVLVAVIINSHLRGTTHYFIANLAVADLLLGTAVLPFSASLEIANGYWLFGQTFCDVWAAVDVLCCTASIMSLCVISIDRYIGVTRPLQHSTIMSERRAACIILIVWILSFAISVAPLLGWKEPPPDNPYECMVTKELGYVLFSVSGSFYIPLIIILVVYFRVYREALSQSRFLSTGIKTSKSDEHKEITLRIHTGRSSTTSPSFNSRSPNAAKRSATSPSYQSSSSSEHSQGSAKKFHKLTLAGKIAKFNREKKAAKTLGIVVGVFILCWLPFFFFLPLDALCKQWQPPEWLFKLIFWLGYCNSTMNPIIYAMSSREFKRAFIRILKCQCRRRPRSFTWETPRRRSTPNVNEMSKFYATVRRWTKKESAPSNKKLLHSTARNGRIGRIERNLAFNEIDSQRRETQGATIISDDESAIMEHSGEEKSEESPSVIVSFPRTHSTEDNGEETIQLMDHKNVWESDPDENEDGIDELPVDVIIDSDDDIEQIPMNGPVDTYSLQDDRVIWL